MSQPDSLLDFTGRWLVVTGASSGLGRAIAIELGAHGAGVALVGRRRGNLEQTAAALGGAPHRIIELDLTLHDAIAPAISQLRHDVGVLYGMCHAAGVVQTRPLASNT